MKKLLRFFIPILWITIGLYIISYFIDMMNMKSTVAFSLGIIGILLIIYLSIVTGLGNYILKPKNNNKL